MDDQNENLEAFIHAFNNDGEYDDEFDNELGSHNAGIL
jgi:hypothetical protein